MVPTLYTYGNTISEELTQKLLFCMCQVYQTEGNWRQCLDFWYPRRPEECVRCPDTDGCSWEPTLYPLEEQPVLSHWASYSAP